MEKSTQKVYGLRRGMEISLLLSVAAGCIYIDIHRERRDTCRHRRRIDTSKCRLGTLCVRRE